MPSPSCRTSHSCGALLLLGDQVRTGKETQSRGQRSSADKDSDLAKVTG